MTVDEKSKEPEKIPLYNVYRDSTGLTDVTFVSKEVIPPSLLNRSLTSISVRYRQYLRNIRKNTKLDELKNRSVNNATITAESK
jgi:hypothetical protein